MEQLLLLGVTKKANRTREQYRSFHYYCSKPSTGYFAMAAAILLELLLRNRIEITAKGIVVLKDKSRTGIGLLDDTLDIIKYKLKRQTRLIQVGDLLWFLSTQPSEPRSLQMPVLRAIDLAVTNGNLSRLGQKDYVAANIKLEQRLVR